MPCPYIDIYDIWLIKPNNTFDKETQRAVKAWQIKNRLSPTGYLTQSDYDKLLAEYKKKEEALFKQSPNPQLSEGGDHLQNKIINYWLDTTIGDKKYTQKLASKAHPVDATAEQLYTSKFTSDTTYLMNQFQKENASAPYYLRKTQKSTNPITLLVLKKKFEQKT